MLCVNPDLVGATCLKPKLYERSICHRLDSCIMREGVLTRLDYGHPLTIARAAAEVGIDDA